VLLLLYLFGTGVAAGALVGGAVFLVLRRPGVAWLAACATAATWVIFAFDWLLYDLDDTRPQYYSFSDYVQYRDAIEGVAGVAIGVGYALLAGLLAAAAARLGRRWALLTVPGVAGAIALPLIVAALLPRAEYGKARVFYAVSRVADNACFKYGVERPDDEQSDDPTLCLTAGSEVETYALARELNESGIRPYEDPDDLGIDGAGLARWSKDPAPAKPTTPQAPPVGGPQTKAKVVADAWSMRLCHRRFGTYVACSDQVEAATVNSFIVARTSIGGTVFTLNHLPRAEVRTCSPRAEGGCPATGTW
jgi:hypothetical protein